MQLRPVTREEYKETEDFVFEVFKHTSYSDGTLEKALVKEMRQSPYYIPNFDLVVEEDGQIIGHFILSKFPINQSLDHKILMLSPVSVALHKQRQGVGSYMLNEGINLAAESGFNGMIVEGDFRYYQRFGFRTSTEFGIYASTKNLPPAEEYLMAMELCENGLAHVSGEVDYSIYKALSH